MPSFYNKKENCEFLLCVTEAERFGGHRFYTYVSIQQYENNQTMRLHTPLLLSHHQDTRLKKACLNVNSTVE